ncbi:Uncharacterized conserved protein, DUF58 family, contains vWF domain [Plantibacter flavus]|uniref:Uncharacterized protein (DUF58 family) n=1 Tax=Plantibacter flavus TaxID=150123 RepID=A0A3N2C411_9MICO|nr:uncharacterized protein (DUF58 family) [Plantibacter flavus]SMG42564.1 Uncharacterized conserved protein, DUF58 family, contains vWF domain [Plantibacter flavus]
MLRGTIRSVTTPLGGAGVVGAIGATVIGVAVGWDEFAVGGTMLAVLVMSSAGFLVGRGDLVVTLALAESSTSVGRSVAAAVDVSRARRGAPARTVVEVPVGADLVELRVKPSGADAHRGTVEIPARRRGVVRVGPARTLRADPIGLFRRELVWTDVHELRVHPETVALPGMGTGLVRDLEGEASRDLTADDLSFHALRDYRAGDDRRHIHWKSTARTGSLTVRQFEETRRSRVAVVFSRATEDFADDEEFELVVSAVASIASCALREGRDVTVLTSPDGSPSHRGPRRRPRVVPTSGRVRMLDVLSEVGTGDDLIPLEQLAALVGSVAREVTTVFVVTGTIAGMRELRSWSSELPAGTQTIAVRCGPEERPGLHRTNALTVLTIGYLDDLRRSFARAVAE